MVGVDTDDLIAACDETGHGHALAHVGPFRPGAGSERCDHRRRVDLGVVAAEAGAEHPLVDRPDHAPHLGTVDQRHVEPIGLARLDELFEHDTLLGRVEVDHPAVGAELERLREVGRQFVVQRPSRQ
jgi:hypothetical protein